MPIPTGVDPDMWASPSYQKFWLATPEGREWLAQQTPQPAQAASPPTRMIGQRFGGQKAVARALPPMQQRSFVAQLPDPSTLSRTDSRVANDISLAMKFPNVYPYYWSEKDEKIKWTPKR